MTTKIRNSQASDDATDHPRHAPPSGVEQTTTNKKTRLLPDLRLNAFGGLFLMKSNIETTKATNTPRSSPARRLNALPAASANASARRRQFSITTNRIIDRQCTDPPPPPNHPLDGRERDGFNPTPPTSLPPTVTVCYFIISIRKTAR